MGAHCVGHVFAHSFRDVIARILCARRQCHVCEVCFRQSHHGAFRAHLVRLLELPDSCLGLHGRPRHVVVNVLESLALLSHKRRQVLEYLLDVVDVFDGLLDALLTFGNEIPAACAIDT